MSDKKSPYEALGIDTKATKEQIQKAYNDLVEKVSKSEEVQQHKRLDKFEPSNLSHPMTLP